MSTSHVSPKQDPNRAKPVLTESDGMPQQSDPNLLAPLSRPNRQLSSPHSVLQLQKMIGNQATIQLLQKQQTVVSSRPSDITLQFSSPVVQRVKFKKTDIEGYPQYGVEIAEHTDGMFYIRALESTDNWARLDLDPKEGKGFFKDKDHEWASFDPIPDREVNVVSRSKAKALDKKLLDFAGGTGMLGTSIQVVSGAVFFNEVIEEATGRNVGKEAKSKAEKEENGQVSDALDEMGAPAVKREVKNLSDMSEELEDEKPLDEENSVDELTSDQPGIQWMDGVKDWLGGKVGFLIKPLNGIIAKFYILGQTSRRKTAFAETMESLVEDDDTVEEKNQELYDLAYYGFNQSRKAFFKQIYNLVWSIVDTLTTIFTALSGGFGAIVTGPIKIISKLAKYLLSGYSKIRGIYKFFRRTRGVERARNAKDILANAYSNKRGALKLLHGMLPFGKVWQAKVAKVKKNNLTMELLQTPDSDFNKREVADYLTLIEENGLKNEFEKHLIELLSSK